MTEQFLHLDRQEQAEIYQTMAERLRRNDNILEKDVWVCWALKALFTMPNRLNMAFKGGTSLSKVYRAIDRFSEDVDITINYRDLDPEFDPFKPKLSKTSLKKSSDALKEFVREHVYDVILPHFRQLIRDEFDDSAVNIVVSKNGEKFQVEYPSALETMGGIHFKQCFA